MLTIEGPSEIGLEFLEIVADLGGQELQALTTAKLEPWNDTDLPDKDEYDPAEDEESADEGDIDWP